MMNQYRLVSVTEKTISNGREEFVFAVLTQTPSAPPSPLLTHPIVCSFAVLAPSAAFVLSPFQSPSLSSSYRTPDAALRHAVFSHIKDAFLLLHHALWHGIIYNSA